MSEWLEAFIEEELDGGGKKPDNRCQLCDVFYSSEYCRLEHLKGRQHQTALLGEQLTMKDSGCTYCQFEYHSAGQRKAHLESRRHRLNRRGMWKQKK